MAVNFDETQTDEKLSEICNLLKNWLGNMSGVNISYNNGRIDMNVHYSIKTNQQNEE